MHLHFPVLVSTFLFVAHRGLAASVPQNASASDTPIHVHCKAQSEVSPLGPAHVSPLEADCNNPTKINATCIGNKLIINNNTAPPIKKPDPNLPPGRKPEPDLEAACWKWCGCQADIEASQSDSTESTGNNVQAIYQNKGTSSRNAAEGSSLHHSSTTTSSSGASVTPVNATVATSSGASITPSTLRTTASSSVRS